jgi:alpha-galactosidase
MKIKALISCVLSCSWFLVAAQTGPVTKTDDPKGWIIQTRSSAYQIVITEKGQVKPVYYGLKEQAGYGKKNAAWSEGIDEIPVRGGLPFKTPMLEVVFADQVRDADLQYVSGAVVTVDGRPALKIIQKDRFYALEVTSYIRVLSEFDILEKWAVVKNTGHKGSIRIENMQSGNIVLPADEYKLTHMSGSQLSEFQLQKTDLTPGLKVLQSKAFKSNSNPPWFMVQPKNADEATGPAWFGSLHYSGNWQLVFDKTFGGVVQILGGINFWDTSWELKAGDAFETPKFAVGFTNDGEEGVSQSLAAYVRNSILPVAHRNELRPVIYNSWEAAYYNVNEKQQLELVETAKDLGVELFTIDDGWFRGRTDGRSQSGLGNWDVDKNKFPNGLTPVIKRVHESGMKFGLWIEPENVNPNSDVIKAHPDWIFQFPNRTGNVFRKILNLANEDAYQFLLNTFTTLLKENAIDFIKWDQNNYLSEPGWSGVPANVQREARIRHTSNVYRLVDELRKRFPKVLFESCASGGGRVDLGMMSRMDQTWLSDNTDPVDRLFIQYGFLSALPANTMVSWVTDAARHQAVSLDYRFDVSMSGVLGIGNDIRKWTPAEKEIAKRKIELYKKIRPLVQQGINYRLASPFESNRCALQYNAADGSSAVVFCYNLAKYLPGSQFIDRGRTVLKLKGLNPSQLYRIKKTSDTKDEGTVYRGDFLMNIGISWPVKNAFESQILTVNVVN